MKRLLVLSAAMLMVGCVPRVPVRFTPRVSTSVPKINPVTLPKSVTMPKPVVTTPKLPHHLTMPLETPPLVKPTTGAAGKGKENSILQDLGGELPIDNLIGGPSNSEEKERKKPITSPRLPR